MAVKRKLSKKFITTSAEETIQLARKFAAGLKPGDCVAFEGTLGSGKTTFIKGIALGLGLDNPDLVKSPTFVIMHRYPTRPTLYHFDLYRLESSGDLLSIGMDEFLHDPDAISCVEWAEKARKMLPSATHTVRLSSLGQDRREIRID